MPSWKVNRRASLTNKISHLGIMGGLASKIGRTNNNTRPTNKLIIPKNSIDGYLFMKKYNLLSKNPAFSGGVTTYRGKHSNSGNSNVNSNVTQYFEDGSWNINGWFNQRLIHSLSKFQFEKNCLPDTPTCYYTTLSGENLSELPVNTMKNIVTVNLLTCLCIKVYDILQQPNDGGNLPAYNFLNYFMSVCFASESFIWGGTVYGVNDTSLPNNTGLLKCYYKELIPWQRGDRTKTLPNLETTNTIPILTSCVMDCFIALVLRGVSNNIRENSRKDGVNTDNLVQYLGQEQQNYESVKLFSTPWTHIINESSILNPPVFKNIEIDIPSGKSLTHNFIFGPSTWLAMSSDILMWTRDEKPTTGTPPRFAKYVSDGEKKWTEAKKYTHIYEKNLVDAHMNVKKREGSFTHSNPLSDGFGLLNQDILSCFNFNSFKEGMSSDKIYNRHKITELVNKIRNDVAIKTFFVISETAFLQDGFKTANMGNEPLGTTINRIILDIEKSTQTQNPHITPTAVSLIQQFYCDHKVVSDLTKCTICPFIDPVVVCDNTYIPSFRL